MAAKIVVTAEKGGSRISLLGSSGKELLGSVVFKEPRAKGATLRALKGLIGEVTIEDHTLRAPARPTAGAARTPAGKKANAVTAATSSASPAPRTASPATKRRSASKAAAPKGVTPKAAVKAVATKAAAATKAIANMASEPSTATTKVAAARKTTKATTARA